jgi:hypothetical protein
MTWVRVAGKADARPVRAINVLYVAQLYCASITFQEDIHVSCKQIFYPIQFPWRSPQAVPTAIIRPVGHGKSQI